MAEYTVSGKSLLFNGLPRLGVWRFDMVRGGYLLRPGEVLWGETTFTTADDGSVSADLQETTGDAYYIATFIPADSKSPIIQRTFQLTANKTLDAVLGEAEFVPPAATSDSTVAALIANAASATATALAGGYVTKPEGLADGQLARWDATLGEWVPANPTGNALLGNAWNQSNVATAVAAPGAGGLGTKVALTGTSITVGNSNGRRVHLSGGATFQQTVNGEGSFFLVIQETTSGLVDRAITVRPLTGTNIAARSFGSIEATIDIGVVTTNRVFDLRAYLYTPASSAPTVNVLNSTSNPSYLRAVAL